MFIGNQEIKSVANHEDVKDVVINFVDEKIQPVTINKQLFDLIKSEEAGNGNITDNIRDYFARKFLAELSIYDLEYSFISNIAIGMETLSHNLREELFRNTFGAGADAINIKLLVDKKE